MDQYVSLADRFFTSTDNVTRCVIYCIMCLVYIVYCVSCVYLLCILYILCLVCLVCLVSCVMCWRGEVAWRHDHCKKKIKIKYNIQTHYTQDT